MVTPIRPATRAPVTKQLPVRMKVDRALFLATSRLIDHRPTHRHARVRARERTNATALSAGHPRPDADAGAHPCRMGRARRPVDIRLRIADLAPGLRGRRAAPGKGARLASRAQDVEPGQPRHDRSTGAGVCVALRRLLPRRRIARAAQRWRCGAAQAVGTRNGDRCLRPEMAALRERAGSGSGAGVHALAAQPELHRRT